MASQQIASVTGFAANTSLGGAATACAAARAGLSRPAALEQDVFDREQGPVPMVGHPVPSVDGFQGEARLLALALPALLDLLETAKIDPRENVGFFVALPDLQARAKVLQTESPRPIGLLGQLAKMARLATPAHLQRAFFAGPVGFALALQAGLDLLANGPARACIVGGIDSHCDRLALDVLATQRRAKTTENPVGLQPGEAAAFLLLESTASTQHSGATRYATIAGAATAREARIGDAPPVGDGLTKAIDLLTTASGPLPVGATWFILDLNGEEGRARDWGGCHPRLVAKLPGLVSAPAWAPAISFGDTGAASAPLSAQMAICAFARGYAPGSCAVVMSSSDDGERAAARIERPS